MNIFYSILGGWELMAPADKGRLSRGEGKISIFDFINRLLNGLAVTAKRGGEMSTLA